MLKIVFMGTPDFAQKSLEAVVEAGYDVAGVVTNQDKPKGRGMKMIASPVKEYALKQELTIYQPEKVKNNKELLDTLKEIQPDVICVVAYGKILSKELLEIPKLGCINVHGSLLPQYRGAAPIQWAVLNGDKTTGITTMYMNEGMDTGDMILKQEVTIREEETTGELWERLADVGANLLVETLKLIEQGKAPREKQGENYTIAPMLNKEMAKINWEEQTATQIKNLVRGLNPIMGAYSYIGDKKVEVLESTKINGNEPNGNISELKEYAYKMKEIMPGTVLFSNPKKGLYIKAKEGIIQALEVQGENAKKMNVLDFLRGNEIMAGTVLE